jgi:surface polysaccharide O-acyltransferase-like enzyme
MFNLMFNLISKKMNKNYLNTITYFRGIAITFVVFSHCDRFGITNYAENSTILAKIITSLMHGSTIFFVFISGFILHYIYYKNFNLKNFMLKKIKFVLIPFLIFSSFDMGYYIVRLIYSYIFQLYNFKIYLNKLMSFNLIKIYLLGHSEVFIALWYVPFIMLIFLFSKFYLHFIKLTLKSQIIIIVAQLILSILIHRSYKEDIYSLFHNVIYFTPVYLLGMFVSSNLKSFYKKMIGKELYVLIIALIITIIQLLIDKPKEIKELNEISLFNLDLMIIQKLLITLFFIIYLKKFENKKLRLLSLLADNSFGIFFIHGIYIWTLNIFIIKFHVKYISNSLIIYSLMASIILAISLITTIYIKRILLKNSKYIIGC